MEILRKNENEMLEIKSYVTGKNIRFISWLDIAKERIAKLEDISIAIFKTEKQREQRLGKQNKKNKKPHMHTQYLRIVG